MSVRRHAIIYVAFIMIFTSNLAQAETTSQWGSWGQSPDKFRQQMESDTRQLGEQNSSYGSGIAGTDEKLLHELDKSSLLDYQQSTPQYNVSLHVSGTESSDNSFSLEATDIITLTGVVSTGLSEGTLDLSKVTELPHGIVDLLQSEGISLDRIESITIESITPEDLDINGTIELFQPEGIAFDQLNDRSIKSIPDDVRINGTLELILPDGAGLDRIDSSTLDNGLEALPAIRHEMTESISINPAN